MKHLKKPLLFLLTAALLLALLAGCGGKNADPNAPDDPGQPSKNGEPAAPVAEGFVYVPKFVTLDYDFSNGLNSRSILYRDGKLLLSSYGVVGSNIPEGVEPEYEGQYDVWGPILFWVDLEGHVEKLEAYEPVPMPEKTNEDGSPIEEMNSSSNIQQLFFSPSGEVVVMEACWLNWYDGPDDVEMWTDEWYEAGYYEYQHEEQHYYLRTLNDDGSEKSSFSFDPLVEKMTEERGWFYINNILPLEDGEYLFCMENDIFRMNAAGELLGSIHSDEYYFENLIRLGDGRIVVSYWGDGGEVLAVVDVEQGQLGEEFKVNGNFYNACVPQEKAEYDLYYTDGSNFMGYTLGAEKSEKVLNWLNCDVDTRNGGSATVLPDGRILRLETTYDYSEEGMPTKVSVSLALLTKTPAAQAEQKQKITLAAQYVDYDIQGEIVKFNRNNPDYRIEVRDYSEYNTEEDYSAGLTKLTAEILAGNVPDIICLNGMPYSRLAAMELLTDLYPMLDSDPELSRDDLFPGVMAALDDNGHLYRTVSGFSINTVVGATSVVGPGPGWTLDEFKAALKSMPEGCEPFEQYVTRGEIFNMFLAMELDNLIDWSTGKCSFDTPAFRDILEFSAMFPESFEYDEDYVWTEEDDTPNRIASGRQMLLRTDLYDFDSFRMYNAMFGGEATFIGYPVSEGVGNSLALNDMGYAISAKCAHKDAAWQFVRTFFTEKYQREHSWAFPSNQAAFDAKLKEAMTPIYETNPDGSYVLDENGQPKEMDRGGWNWGSIEIHFYAMTQAEADAVVDIIKNTTRVSTLSDDEILQIIQNDCEAYFAGQKSAEEVARLLQSKLNIYINERR